LIVAWVLCVVIGLSDPSGMYDMSTLSAVSLCPPATVTWCMIDILVGDCVMIFAPPMKRLRFDCHASDSSNTQKSIISFDPYTPHSIYFITYISIYQKDGRRININ
jgi:hypothetical protein